MQKENAVSDESPVVVRAANEIKGELVQAEYSKEPVVEMEKGVSWTDVAGEEKRKDFGDVGFSLRWIVIFWWVVFW